MNSLGILSACSGLESSHALPSKDAVDLVGAVSSQLDDLGALQALGLPCPVNCVSIPVGYCGNEILLLGKRHVSLEVVVDIEVVTARVLDDNGSHFVYLS